MATGNRHGSWLLLEWWVPEFLRFLLYRFRAMLVTIISIISSLSWELLWAIFLSPLFYCPFFINSNWFLFINIWMFVLGALPIKPALCFSSYHNLLVQHSSSYFLQKFCSMLFLISWAFRISLPS